MLNKVKSLAYKTKINVKIKSKIKIVYVLILSIFLVSRKTEQEILKKAGSSKGLSQNSVPA